jgi:hypothetical protein
MFDPLHDQGKRMSEPAQPPPLTESARAVYAAARGVAGAWGGHFQALRELLLADLALAREATLRAMLLLALAAIVFGTCWALLTVLCVWLLHATGLNWAIALGLPIAAGVVVGIVALAFARKALRLARLDASREQLRALLDSGDAAKPDAKTP